MKKAFILILALVLLLVPSLTGCGKDDGKKNQKTVKVSMLEISSAHELNDVGEKYAVITPDKDGELKYKIECAILPVNATNKEVDFHFDKEIDYVTVAPDGMVVFDKAKVGSRGLAVKITVTPKDGTDKRDSITIFALNQ